MRAASRIFVWIVPTVAFMLACSITPAATSTPVPSGGILYQDDFSDDSSGWDVSTDEYGTTAYLGGQYLMTIQKTLSYLTVSPGNGGTYTDVRVEVDVTSADPNAHDMGVLCRIVDENNFYYLIIASDGYYAIGKFVDGEDTLIGADELQADENGVIQTGMAANRVRGDCVGSTLTLYANGEKLFETTDTDFASGEVGLVAGTYEDVPVTVKFDNFTVKKP